MDWTCEDECELSSLEGRGFGSKGRLLRDSQGQEEARFESMFRKRENTWDRRQKEKRKTMMSE